MYIQCNVKHKLEGHFVRFYRGASCDKKWTKLRTGRLWRWPAPAPDACCFSWTTDCWPILALGHSSSSRLANPWLRMSTLPGYSEEMLWLLKLQVSTPKARKTYGIILMVLLPAL